MGNIVFGDSEVDRLVAESQKKSQAFHRAKKEERDAIERRERSEGPRPGHEPAAVLSWLYIGDRFTVRDVNALRDAHIAYILQLSPVETPHAVYEKFEGADVKNYLRLPADDTEIDNIYMEFDKADKFIDKGRQAWENGDEKHRVLVYCDEGVSRSATIVLSYLIKQGWTLKGAIEYLKRLRPKSAPNKGYYKQLMEREKNLLGSNSVSLEDYNTYFAQ